MMIDVSSPPEYASTTFLNFISLLSLPLGRCPRRVSVTPENGSGRGRLPALHRHRPGGLARAARQHALQRLEQDRDLLLLDDERRQQAQHLVARLGGEDSVRAQAL